MLALGGVVPTRHRGIDRRGRAAPRSRPPTVRTVAACFPTVPSAAHADNKPPAPTPAATRVARRSVDGRFLTFTGVRAPVGTAYPDARARRDGQGRRRRHAGPTSRSARATSGIRAPPSAPSRSTARATWVGGATRAAARDARARRHRADRRSRRVRGQPPSSVELVDGSLVDQPARASRACPAGCRRRMDTTTAAAAVHPAARRRRQRVRGHGRRPGADTAYVTRGTAACWKYRARRRRVEACAARLPGSFALRDGARGGGAVEVYLTASEQRKRMSSSSTRRRSAASSTTTGARRSRSRRAGRASPAWRSRRARASRPTRRRTRRRRRRSAARRRSRRTSARRRRRRIKLDVFDANTADVDVTASRRPPDRPRRTTGSRSRARGTRRTVTFDPAAAGTATVTLTATAKARPATITVSLGVTGPGPDPTRALLHRPGRPVGRDRPRRRATSSASRTRSTPSTCSRRASRAARSRRSTTASRAARRTSRARRASATRSCGRARTATTAPARPARAPLPRVPDRSAGTGEGVELEYRNSYTRLWDQWKAWDAANGHGLGANKLKFNTATVPGVVPNAPCGFNVEGVTMAPGSQTTAWFGMRAPTVTGDDGIERARDPARDQHRPAHRPTPSTRSSARRSSSTSVVAGSATWTRTR